MPTQLTPEQARRLLAPVGEVTVASLRLAATINDVFQVVTRDHGTFYIKFHTARWYADQPDTAFVAEREAAVCELLAKRGSPLPYRAWADTSRSVVSRSVFISGELPGIPVTEAAQTHPEQAEAILAALGSYFRRLHAIEFTNPGLLSAEHAKVTPPAGTIPYVKSWDDHPLHHPEHLQRDALRELDRVAREGLLPSSVTAMLASAFSHSAEVVRPEYEPPRFTIGNCHAHHFYVARNEQGWQVQGCFDFEAASAGASTTDLVELEVTLTPALRSYAWRPPFFNGYGGWPALQGYQLRLLYYLLCELGRKQSVQVPDPAWLAARWPTLLAAETWDELDWFPA